MGGGAHPRRCLLGVLFRPRRNFFTALGASIYPAVQNLLLAAHAAGLGTVLTTRWKPREAEVLPLLGLPEDMAVHAIIPMGWPEASYGRNRRRPVAEVTSRERYGEPW